MYLAVIKNETICSLKLLLILLNFNFSNYSIFAY